MSVLYIEERIASGKTSAAFSPTNLPIKMIKGFSRSKLYCSHNIFCFLVCLHQQFNIIMIFYIIYPFQDSKHLHLCHLKYQRIFLFRIQTMPPAIGVILKFLKIAPAYGCYFPCTFYGRCEWINGVLPFKQASFP